MKKNTLLLGFLIAGTTAFGQVFSDDFESYNTGAIGPQSAAWTTWSGTEGGTEEGIISTAQANGGTKSVYFNSTAAGGGPQDCVLDFGTVYNSGVFTYQADFYVSAGKSAYFNFQAAQPIGTTWGLNVNMANGVLTVDDGITAELATGSFTHASWFTFRIEANLTLGIWEAFIDGASLGVWQNGINTLASVDNFPLQGSQFYIDNLSYDIQSYTIMNLNAAVAGLDMGGNIATQNVSPVVSVMNAGTTAITSFDVTLDYAGTQYTQNVTGQNLASLATYDVTFTGISLTPGSNVAIANITNINGGADDDATDNVTSVTVDPVVPALGKMVVGEEGTGTWCQWCPRGAVYMDLFEQQYDAFWAGIAVHNADPMTVTAYDTGMGALVSGYPSALVDRGAEVDPSAMGSDFYSRLQVSPTALITNGATWDPATRILNVSVSAEFQSAANSNYKLACILTEDGVTGTTGYSQSNAYAGGGNGVMGGFESLPNPVPAALMVYDHVARAISPSFTGEVNSFPAAVNSGETHTVTFSFTLPSTWDETNMHIVGMLFGPTNRIDNAGKATISEAVANGFVNGPAASVTELLAQPDATMQVYPNPANDFAVVALNLVKESQIAMKLIDVSGKTLAVKNYGSMSGMMNIELNTATLQSGVYIVELTVDNDKLVKRLVVE